MTGLLVFSVTLLLAMLVSALSERTALSTTVLFLLAGVLVGPVSGLYRPDPTSPAVTQLVWFALVGVLFSDGMKLGWRDIAGVWRLPGRALFVGMPLTMLGIALMAHWVTRVPWGEAFLLGAVLSPTDPVLSAAIVGRSDIPSSLRQLLNVESGVNDGLALPAVVLILGALRSTEQPFGALALSLLGGIVLGVAIPLGAILLERLTRLAVLPAQRALFVLALGLVVISAAEVSGANAFLAAFAAGVTIASVSPESRDAFRSFGDNVVEILKFAAVLAFGVLLWPHIVTALDGPAYLFAALALFVVRPVALGVALLRSPLDWPERVTVGWFGPKGFASIIFTILVLQSGLADGARLAQLAGLVIVASIIAHSSTDVPIARWFRRREARRSERRA